MNTYQQKGAEVADQIRSIILTYPHQSFGHKLFTNIVLTIAEEIAMSAMKGNTLALKSVRYAGDLAKKDDCDRIGLIATDGLIRDTQEDELRAKAGLFLHKAINYAAKKKSKEDGTTIFEFIANGFAILYESDMSIDWLEKIRRNASL